MTRILPPMPAGIAALERDARGFPIPWFVSWPPDVKGPDFVRVDRNKVGTALRFRVCWVCGGNLPPAATFVLGPMCGVNRISSEPPSCFECAEFTARVCPFLTRPMCQRVDHPEKGKVPGMIEHNPGVTLLWTCNDYGGIQAGDDETGPCVLIKFGEPMAVSWWREGRAATRDEVETAVNKGLGIIRQMAIREGGDSQTQLNRRLHALQRLYPKHEAVPCS